MRAQVGRVAIYCRVSTGDQSCERQERDLLAYAERCGYEVAGVWKETVSGARNDRAQRKAVVAPRSRDRTAARSAQSAIHPRLSRSCSESSKSAVDRPQRVSSVTRIASIVRARAGQAHCDAPRRAR